ncbi:MAG: response regulator [Lachnospiraceae bacterium]
MRYKLLLLGTNMAAIDDFFRRMENNFEILTSSMHFEDIKGHVKYFQPDAIVYCMHREPRKSITNLISIKQKTNSMNIPFVIIGDQEDCDECMKIAVNVVDLKLVKPLTASVISDQLMDYLRSRNRKEERVKEAEKIASIPEQKPVTQNLDAVLEDLDQLFGTSPVSEMKTVAAVPPIGFNPRKKSDLLPGEKLRILIIDDDVRMIKVLKRHLEDNYQVATAVSGKVALRYLETKSTDLILLDYVMPEMDGPQVLAEIRKNPAMADVPVLFLTGAAEKSKIQKALSLKPQGYLLKPIDREKLIEKIESVLNK